MSRIGRKPVKIPDRATVQVQEGMVRVEGPKGKLAVSIHPHISVSVDSTKKELTFSRPSDLPADRALHGTMRVLVHNALTGVTQGFEKTLQVVGVGYQAKVEGKELVLNIGFSKPYRKKIPEGIQVECPDPTAVVIRGVDRQQLGQFSADVRAIRPPNPYTLKGIKYREEVVRKKAGKSFVGGTGGK